MIAEQPWKPPYEVVEVPSDKVRLCFPENYFSATIVGGHIQLSVSTDLAGLPAVIERLEKLLEFAELGPMPQSTLGRFPREAVEGDFSISDAPTPDRSGEADKTAKQGLAVGESGLPEGSSE